MRTTLTLDEDLARQLKELARQSGRSFKEVTNEAIRRGLSAGAPQVETSRPFRVKPKACGFRPGVDPLKLNQIYDDLESDGSESNSRYGVHEPVIIPDINLLVYSYNSDAPFHTDARDWWERCLSDPGTVGLPWAVILGFIRIMTSNAVFTDPMETLDAVSHVRSWLNCSQIQIVTPGPRHLEILTDILKLAQASGRLTTDAHLAALAIETQSELHSNDVDFARFPGLRWKNPIG